MIEMGIRANTGVNIILDIFTLKNRIYPFFGYIISYQYLVAYMVDIYRIMHVIYQVYEYNSSILDISHDISLT